MINLNDIRKNISHKIKRCINYRNKEITNIAYDSRKIKKSGLFFVLKGEHTDGALYIQDAIKRGCVALIIDAAATIPNNIQVPIIIVSDISEVMGLVAYYFYNLDKFNFNISFTTGTNGKSSIAFIVESILNASNIKSGIISTINHRACGKVLSQGLTTPLVLDLMELISKSVKCGAKLIFMELSSHAIVQKRYFPLQFQVGIFTNATHDHLEYHKTFQNYADVKKSAFTSILSKSEKAIAGIVNIDDKTGEIIAFETKNIPIITYSLLSENASLRAINMQFSLNGIKADVALPNGEIVKVSSSLIGRHNLYNILAAIGYAFVIGIEKNVIEQGINSLRVVPGRLEKIDNLYNFSVFVDYAHTPAALESVIKSVKEITDKKIIVVFGAGGSRDKSKRPEMGRIVEQLADIPIVTSDNPRAEEPNLIISDILAGMKDKNTIVEPDRKKAIKKAVTFLDNDSMLLVCGKGHEPYQILKNKTIHFDDREILREILC